MRAPFRQLAAIWDTLIYGAPYALMQYLVRSPRLLDPEKVWKLLMRQPPAGPVFNFFRFHHPPAFARRLLLASRMRQDHRLGIAEHYDVSNDFYELFLDKKFMFYSCADFPTGKETIEEAQTIKANFILGLIDPKPGEKILELGCGWGPMMRHIAATTGDPGSLTGYTLSTEQASYVQAKFGFNVEFKNFITGDYQPEAFDKVYAIGAWEHVRADDLDGVLKKIYQTLKPGGRFVNHFFAPLTDTITPGMFAAQVFFPGSMPPSHPSQFKAYEKAGFRVTHRSIHDYRPTLRAWFDNLVANRERAISLVGMKVFNKYVAFFPGSWRYFDDAQAILVRYVLEKPF
ncbi:MAG: class SAM-dependent methyltransferase [Hydrocarboniphaga sp.]|uniref:class I SAM-dependent methyltransferase n=1 Tax=Hydrocarboniphaga sp. TaxID=2033016 RepID=UPI0026309D63|nr:class I SAM-dependent methyltransferase [Hydrocarboniphaga sp.]MDB5972127.1 class SAM-dependent methyltransferase [Hydrocarboniphaga sp.]